MTTTQKEWIGKITRRRRALALVLAEGEKERNFFRCNYYGLLTTAGVLSSAQFTMWGYMSFSIVTAVEKSPLQSALSLSAFAFSGLGGIVGNLLGGYLYDIYGAVLMFQVKVYVTLCAAVLFFLSEYICSPSSSYKPCNNDEQV